MTRRDLQPLISNETDKGDMRHETRDLAAGAGRPPYRMITERPPYRTTARSVTVPSAFARSSMPVT